MPEIQKMNLKSEDLVADRLDQLRELMPEAFSESGIDFEKLRLLLGDEVDEGQERYAFTWPGKTDAIRQSQIPSTATLRPRVEKSRGRDGEDGSFDSDNIYIEGDNLEVLKLLQRGYHGKVKMIYIDPPYNTGHDFVYKDKFGDTIENYKEQAGLAGQSNAETNGRFHSDWCSMMYPRLKLARELLSDDGTIFISIGNQEVSNLISICDEIFGEPCSLGIIAWESKTKCQNTSTAKRQLQPKQEYILVYERTQGRYEFFLESKEAHEYDHVDDSGRPFRYKRIEEMSANGTRGRATMIYPILGVVPGESKHWKLGRATVESYEQRGDLLLLDGVPCFRCRPEDEEDSMLPFWSLFGKEIGTAESAKSDLKKLMGETGFETVKPVELVRKLIQYTCGEDTDSIVMDFFGGSSTTADAAMHFNAGLRKRAQVITIQIPERCPEDGDSFAVGYRTLTEIGEERIRRAGDKIKSEIEESNRQPKLGEEPKKLPDIGFRVFTLDDSGIQKPRPGELIPDVVKPDRSDMDIVFEMMLKWGLELTLPVEREEAAGYPIYSVACGELVCCLAPGLTNEALEAIADMEPRRVLMRDSVLTDTLKLNAVQIFKRVGERTGREVELRTV